MEGHGEGTVISRTAAELVHDAHAEQGEGPTWNGQAGTLDWVDIAGQCIHRFDPRSGEDVCIPTGQDIGAIGLRSRGGYILALRDGFALMEEGTSRWSMLAEVEAADLTMRMNDGKADGRGRFWAGTIPYDPLPFEPGSGRGALYRLDPDGTVTRVLTGLGISNGLDWTMDDRTMYFIDSFDWTIDCFDFDLSEGSLGNRRKILDVENDTSSPAGLSIADGMTLDAEGHLWIAMYGKGEVHRYTPTGCLEAIVDVDATGVSSCAFGGDDLGDLYITSQSRMPGGDDPRRHPGGLFRVRPGVSGRPPRMFAG